MNSSVCRAIMGVAGLAVLGMTATLAGAQTVEVKAKPPLIGPAFGSMRVNFTPQADFVHVNATYK